MNNDTTIGIGIYGGAIIGVFFGTLFNSWISTLIYMSTMLVFIIITKLFVKRELDEVKE